jgi:hypothetical protein
MKANTVIMPAICFPTYPPRPSEKPIPLDETDFLDNNGEDFFERETKPFDCVGYIIYGDAVCAA